MSDIDGGSNADHSFETKDAQQQTQSPSFLGNRKGLFGNSAILLKSPTSLDDKESTTTTEPKISHKEVLPNNDSSNTEKSSNGVKDSPIALEKETVDVDMENGDSKEPEDNGVQASDPPVVPAEGNVNEEEVVEEEPCVKKIVSVCTEDNDEGVDSAMESAETESVSQEPSSSLAMEIGSEESEQEKYDQPEEEVHDTITTGENVDDESTATAVTEDVNESEEKEDEKESENADTTNTEEKEETEEPKKRRGRPSRTPARNSDSVASEETETTEKTPKRGRRSAVTTETVTTPATATPTPGRGRGRPARTPKVEEEKEKELPPQSSSRGRRGKKASEGEEMEQETEKVKETPNRRSTRAKKASESTIASKSEENVEDEAEAEGSVTVEKESESDSNAEESTKTPTRGRGRRSVVATSASKKVEAKEKATPTRKVADKTPRVATSSQKRSRGRPGRPPKSSEEPEEVKETEEDDEEEEESPKEEVKTPKRGRKPATATAATPVPSSAKSVKATPKSTKKAKDEDDPYDFDIEVDNHPEPLKNIQMEVQSFGQVRYSKVGVSTSKYEQTEKAAQERIPNLLDISSGSKVPEKRKSLMELNKKEMELSAAGSKSVPARRRKKQDDEDDEMDFEDATTTPKKRGKALVGTSATPKTPSTAGRKRKTSPSSTPIPKSKQPKVEVPQLDAVSQLSADLPEDGPPGVVPGSRVYALYDKVYYPAIVINRDGLGRFQVYFVEDAIVKELPEASVIPIASLNNGKLAAINNEEDTVSVHVISVPKAADWLDGMFELEAVEDETKTYSKPWDQIMLAMEDWKEYIKAKSAHATDVKTDNIESTEDRVRRRRSTAASSITTTSSASSSKTPSKPKTPRSVKAKVDESMNMETDEVAEKKTPVKAPSNASSPNKRRGRPSAAKQEKEEEEKKEKEEVKEEEKEEKEEKPVEKEKIKSPVKVSAVTTSSSSTTAPIFDRKVFILTSANRPTGEGKLPFRKNEMKLRILERGGHVVDDIMSIPLDADAYLISDTYYRTHKFLAALARNMPCVSHEWIHFCVVQEQLLDYHSYQMQAGVSLLDTKVHDAPDVRGKLLVGLRVCVHSTNEATQKVPSFTQIWAPIVEVLGGDLRTPQQALDGDANVLVTDTTCDPQYAATVSKKGVEVVSSEWLIQAIIMGIRPPYDGHPRFRHEALIQDGQGTVSNA